METTIKKYWNLSVALAIALIVMAVVLRILPHPANFAPVAAVALFGGAILPRHLALLAPLAAMVISDLVIGLHDTVLVTWGSYVLIALAASVWLRSPSLVRGGFLTIGSSVFFFVATNFAVWVQSGMYEHSLNGLIRCYEMALPFFRNTLLSDLFYTSVLFGVFVLVTKMSPKVMRAYSLGRA